MALGMGDKQWDWGRQLDIGTTPRHGTISEQGTTLDQVGAKNEGG